MLWSVTLGEALDWAGYNIKRRYEWVEWLMKFIGGAFSADEPPARKSCRHPQVCMMCRKKCKSRIADYAM